MAGGSVHQARGAGGDDRRVAVRGAVGPRGTQQAHPGAADPQPRGQRRRAAPGPDPRGLAPGAEPVVLWHKLIFLNQNTVHQEIEPPSHCTEI